MNVKLQVNNNLDCDVDNAQPICANDECRYKKHKETLYRQLKFKLHNIELVWGLKGTQRDTSF